MSAPRWHYTIRQKIAVIGRKRFERESQIIRNSTRRTDHLAAQADMAKQSAAE